MYKETKQYRSFAFQSQRSQLHCICCVVMFDSQDVNVFNAGHIESIAVIHRQETFTYHYIRLITNHGIDFLNTFGAHKGAVYVKMIETIKAEKLQNVLI